MRKMKALVASLVIVAFISFGTVSNAVSGKENQRDTLMVNNWKGTHVGIVKYVVANIYTGNIIFIVLYLDKEGKKEVLLPLEVFSSYDQENGSLILNISPKELVSAFEFHDSDLNDPGFAESVYRSFGLAPSWTDETREQGISLWQMQEITTVVEGFSSPPSTFWHSDSP